MLAASPQTTEPRPDFPHDSIPNPQRSQLRRPEFAGRSSAFLLHILNMSPEALANLRNQRINIACVAFNRKPDATIAEILNIACYQVCLSDLLR